MTDKQADEFIREGMSRYGRASHVLVAFMKEVEGKLQAVLKERQTWGTFKPSEASKTKSTRYWSAYPLLNAKIDGELRGKQVSIQLSVNWYQSDGGYPFYSVLVYPKDDGLDNEMSRQEWPEGLEYEQGQLRLWPDPEDFNLERDCGRLLDGFVEFLSASARP